MPSAICTRWAVDRLGRRTATLTPGQLGRPAGSAGSRSRGPIAQRGPVSRVRSEALEVTSCIRCRIATISATSGSRSSPLRPTISTGTPASVRASKTSAACALSRVRTPILDQGTLPSSGCAARTPATRAASSSRWVSWTAVVTTPSPASGLGSSGATASWRVVERSRQQVGGLEDPPLGASVDGERVRRHGAGHGGERLGEVEDVGDRRAAPAVDRLVGVADRGHRVPAAAGRVGAGEDPRQHDGLGDRGVLVLVEEHHPELVALERADVGLQSRPVGHRARSGRRSP